MIISSLTRPEDEALSNALMRYFKENEKTLKTHSAHKSYCISLLKDKLLAIYCSSPDIEKVENDFDYSTENILYALKPDRDGAKKKLCPPHKARFLVWALEFEGYYKRPKHQSRDSLYDSLVSFIYKDKPEGYKIVDHEEIEGVYLVKRLSFNNAFPGKVTVCRMWIWFDKEKEILRYQTMNKYTQDIGAKKIDRERVTKGYVFKFQGNMLFIGDVDYTHLKESEKKTSHYPEIFLAHAHGGDRKNIRGLIIGNYPFLNLPVATSILISKELPIEDESVKHNLDNYDINNDLLTGLKKLKSLKKQKKFILNKLEKKYSNMLTP